jgi:hypothetical protein
MRFFERYNHTILFASLCCAFTRFVWKQTNLIQRVETESSTFLKFKILEKRSLPSAELPPALPELLRGEEPIE